MAVQFLSFSGVGAIATLLHYAILVLAVHLAGTDPTLASSIGFILSASFNYAMNYRLTFRSNKRHREAFPKFLVIAFVGLVLNGMFMAVATRGLRLHYLIGQVIATSSVVLWNFFGNRLWTFR